MSDLRDAVLLLPMTGEAILGGADMVQRSRVLELIDAHSCAQQTLDNVRQAVADEPTLSWPGEIDDILDDEQRRLRAGATT